jgi:hydrogenase 3 maturation protease
MSPSLNNDVKSVLSARQDGIVAVLAIGNTLRQDDGIGSYIAGKIKSGRGYHIFDAGDRPENFIEKIISISPAAIVILDAANFKGIPGEIRVIPEEAIATSTISTHTIPPGFIYALLREGIKVPIAFVGIQFKNIDFGEELSTEVKRAGDEIIRFIEEQQSRNSSKIQDEPG